MKLIVGLGNVGKKYDNTRHNVGFEFMDKILREWSEDKSEYKESKKFDCYIAEIEKEEKILLVKPTTFMNLSGKSVAKLVNFYDINIDDVWVVHDDLDIQIGQMRIKKSGGHAGHHGVESIINALKSNNFLRFRIGVGKSGDKDIMSKDEGASYVLSRFGASERKNINEVLEKTIQAVGCCLSEDVAKCMHMYNKKISGNMPME